MIKLGIVMDPIGSIKPYKDSSFAMLLEAQRRGWSIAYMELGDLFLRDGVACARMTAITVQDSTDNWHQSGDISEAPLDTLDVVLMRKDPPYNAEYHYTTHMLELAADKGTLVVNDPGGLRDVNEKLFTAWFPDCCVPTLVSRDTNRFRRFITEQGDIIIKPLGLMGGASIFRIRQGDPNTSVILENMTAHGREAVMAQRFIAEVSEGDKRILLIDGEPVPYALARIPAKGETRGNLAAGGEGVGVELTERDRFIVSRVAPKLKEMGMMFVGLDVIGDFLTEINVTSPTCIRELDKIYALNISATLLDVIEVHLNK